MILTNLGRVVHDRVVTLAAGIDGAVRRIATVYDARGRVTKVTSFDNATVGSGSVVNEVERVYNAFNQMTEDRQEHDGAVDGSTRKVAYAHADASANTVRRTSVTYPSGKVVSISYGSTGSTDDRLSRMAETAVGGEGSALAQFTWMGSARLVKLNLPQPEVSLNYESLDSLTGDAGDPYVGYDRFGRTVDMRWIKNGGDDINRVQYGYDRASRRLWRQELAAPADKNQDRAWTYDGLGQVTSANRGVININRTAIGGVPAEGERFAYDPIGNWNRYQKLEDGLGTLDQTRVHNTDNQITQVDAESKDLAYDAAGNMTRTPVGVAKIVWDAWNRMVLAESEIQEPMAACQYDGLSRRTQLTNYGTVTEFYYNEVWKCVEEYENSGASPSQIYYWGMRPGHRDELIRRGGGDSHVRWCVMDYFDPITILDEDGIPQERYGYTAFGEVEYYLANFAPKTSGFSDFNFLFHGQFRDAETGWYDYGYRYYVPALGRWASRDPIGEAGGVNVYIGFLTSSVNQIDRLGLACCGDKRYSPRAKCCCEGDVLKSRTPQSTGVYRMISRSGMIMDHSWLEQGDDSAGFWPAGNPFALDPGQIQNPDPYDDHNSPAPTSGPCIRGSEVKLSPCDYSISKFQACIATVMSMPTGANYNFALFNCADWSATMISVCKSVAASEC